MIGGSLVAQPAERWIVYESGGSILAGADCLRRVTRLVSGSRLPRHQALT